MLLRVLAFVSCFFGVLGIVGSPVFAQAENVEQSSLDQAEDLLKMKSDTLNDRVKGVMDDLDQAQMTHFMIIHANYSIFSMVKAVNNDIGAAITGCKDNNSDLVERLDEKYVAWQEEVGPGMEEVDKNIKSLVLAQDYVPKEELDAIFSLIDELRETNSSQFETTPLTTVEACEFMISKIAETKDSMNLLLQSTLTSYPNAVQRNQK